MSTETITARRKCNSCGALEKRAGGIRVIDGDIDLPGVPMDEDHPFPKCILGPKGKRGNSRKHPLREAIYHEDNKFDICREEHEKLDKVKTGVYLGYFDELGVPRPCDGKRLNQDLHDPYRGDPVSLIKFLNRFYMTPTDPNLFTEFIGKMTRTIDRLLDGIPLMNGQFSDNYKSRFHLAIPELKMYRLKLVNLPHPSNRPYFSGKEDEQDGLTLAG